MLLWYNVILDSIKREGHAAGRIFAFKFAISPFHQDGGLVVASFSLEEGKIPLTLRRVEFVLVRRKNGLDERLLPNSQILRDNWEKIRSSISG